MKTITHQDKWTLMLEHQLVTCGYVDGFVSVVCCFSKEGRDAGGKNDYGVDTEWMELNEENCCYCCWIADE